MNLLKSIDGPMMAVGVVILIVFGAICYAVFNYALTSTKFEDEYPAERLQLLISDNKKEKKGAKPNKKKNKTKKAKDEQSTQNESADRSETPEEIEEAVDVVVEEPVAAVTAVVEKIVADVVPQKKNKKNKQKKDSVADESVESIEAPVEVEHVSPVQAVQEEVVAQKSNPGNNKKRNKRAVNAVAASPEEVVHDLNEDKFISRIASIDELQSEYIAFINDFMHQSNAEKQEMHGFKDQVQILQSQLREKERSLKAKEDEIIKGKKELTAARSETGEVQRIKVELADQKNLNAKLTKELKDTQNVLSASVQKQGDVSELTKVQKELSDAKNQVNVANLEARKLKTEVDQLKDKVNHFSKVDSQKSRDLEAKLKNSEAFVLSLQATIEKLEDDKSILVLREQEMILELNGIQKEIDALTSTRFEKENIVQSAQNEDEQIKLRSDYEEILKKNEALNGSVNKLNFELKKASVEVHALQVQCNELKRKSEKDDDEKFGMLKKIDILERKLADFVDHHDRSSDQMHQLKNELKSLELEKNDLKNQLIEERELVDKLEQQKQEAVPEAPQVSSNSSEEVATLKKEKEHLYNRMLTLTEAVNTAENLTSKTVKERDAQFKELMNNVAAKIAESLQQINVKASQPKVNDVNALNSWIHDSVLLAKSVPVEAVAAPVHREKSPKKSVSFSESPDVEHLHKLREENNDLKSVIAHLESCISRIEEAYQEKAREVESELQAAKHG